MLEAHFKFRYAVGSYYTWKREVKGLLSLDNTLQFQMSILLVVKSFIKNLPMTKSSDCKSDLVKGHASRPYKSTLKHNFAFNYSQSDSPEATRPIAVR